MSSKASTRLKTQTIEMKPDRKAERYKRSQNYQKQFLKELSDIVHQTDFMVDLTKTPARKQPAWMGQTIKNSKIKVSLPEDEDEYQNFLTQSPKITSQTKYIQKEPCSDDEYQNIEKSAISDINNGETPNNNSPDEFIWKVEIDEDDEVHVTKDEQVSEAKEEEEEEVLEELNQNNEAEDNNNVCMTTSQSIPADGETALAKVFALIEEEEDTELD